MERGSLRGLYVIGENPAQSEADQHHSSALLQGLDHLVVQEIFLTATAQDGGRRPSGGLQLV